MCMPDACCSVPHHELSQTATHCGGEQPKNDGDGDVTPSQSHANPTEQNRFDSECTERGEPTAETDPDDERGIKCQRVHKYEAEGDTGDQ